MPVPTSIDDLSPNAIENSPQGTEPAKGTIDDYFRSHASFIAKLRDQVNPIASTLSGRFNVRAYGAIGNGIADDTTAIQAALDAAAGKELVIPAGTYKCTAGLVVKGNVVSDGAVLSFAATTIASLVSQSVEASMSGFTIDGTGVTNCEYGLFVDTDFAQKSTCRYNLRIRNIKNADNTKGCNGALFYKSSSAATNPYTKLNIKLDVEGVTATANGVNGDTGGSSCGILVSFNGAGTDCHVVVRDCIVKDIGPVEDSGGIQLYTGDHTTAAAKGLYLVDNCVIYNAKKRGVKVQSQNTLVRNCTVHGEDTTVGFDTYAVDTVMDNCRYVAGNSTGFRVGGAKTLLRDCVAETNSQQPTLRIEGGASDTVVIGGAYSNTATLADVANSIALVDAVASALFDHVTMAGSGSTGCALSVGGASNVRLDGCSLANTAHGIFLPYSTGSVKITGSSVNAASDGVHRLGNTTQLVVCYDSTITAAGIGFYLSGSGIDATADIANCKIFANAQGVLVNNGSRIVNTEITSTGVTGNGIVMGNSVARGNRISKYAIGISYAFSTTAEVANNVTIGTATPYETTSFTAFVNHDNYSR